MIRMDDLPLLVSAANCGSPYNQIANARSGQTKALKPVMAFPTIRVFISRVPSYE